MVKTQWYVVKGETRWFTKTRPPKYLWCSFDYGGFTWFGGQPFVPKDVHGPYYADTRQEAIQACKMYLTLVN